MSYRNVVLIVLDTVRKDYFDEYAYRLQDRSDVTFSNCRAASSWSVPSHASMITGELPHVHGIHTHDRYFDNLQKEQTFFSSLPDHTSLGASANVFASETFGFDSVFDDYSDIAQHRRFPQGIDMEKFIQDREQEGLLRFWEFLKTGVRHEYPLQSLANGATFKLNDLMLELPIPKITDDGAKLVKKEGLRKIREHKEPFFLFTNFMDAHAPLQHVVGFDKSMHSASNNWSSRDFEQWEVILNGIDEHNQQDVENHRDLYTCAVEYLDRQVSAFIDEIQAETEHETTFIVTADHGENLGFEGDNGLFGHTNSLTEALLHVPFEIINPPNGFDKEYNEYFSHLDLGTLVAGLGHNDITVETHTSIPAEVIGSGVNDPPRGDKEYWDRMIRCIYRDQEKIEWDSEGGTYRYGLREDKPSWQTLQADGIEIPDWASEFFDGEITEAKRHAREAETSREVTTATQDRLEDLGYI
jgi:Arylsulfatase A and related enzymes